MEAEREDQLLDKALNPNTNYKTGIDVLVGDMELGKFLLEWVNNGHNATVAYKKLHPEVTDHSARVLGCRKLAKVNKSALAEMYGVGLELFFTKIYEGLDAKKWNPQLEEYEPDYTVRKTYLDLLAKTLNESDS